MTDEQRWHLAGTAPEIYAEHLVPAVFAPWAPVLLDAAAVGIGHTVLDVACGTGVVAAAAAERVGPSGAVTGVDINPGMIAVAARTQGVRWAQADAARLPFPDGGFDRVLCQAGLQFVPDRLGALREMRRVLRPGGRVALLVWRALHHSPGFAALADALQAVVGPEAAAVMRAPFVFGDDPRPLVTLLDSAGFGDVRRAGPRRDRPLRLRRGLRALPAGGLAAGRARGRPARARPHRVRRGPRARGVPDRGGDRDRVSRGRGMSGARGRSPSARRRGAARA